MKLTNTRGADIQNVTTKKDGNKVTLTFDLAQNEGTSKSGKSVLVSSSHGECEIAENTFISYNIYRKLPKENRVKPAKAVASGAKETKEQKEYREFQEFKAFKASQKK